MIQRFTHCLVLCLIFAAFAGAVPKETPVSTVHRFYDWYFERTETKGNVFSPPYRKTLTQFFTARFLRSASSSKQDANPFLIAQDYPDRFDRSFKVTERALSGDKATVQMEMTWPGFDPALQKFEVALVLEKGEWKIDGIRRP